MKRTATVSLVMLTAVVALAYLPVNWSNRNANHDFTRSDAVLVGRVIAISRSHEVVPDRTNNLVAFTYTASIAVARVFRGDIRTNQVLAIPIGGYWQTKLDEAEPTWVHQCNTQRGFDLDINGIYLLALTKTVDKSGHTNWVPRSGHRSVYEIRRIGDAVQIRTPSAWYRSAIREGDGYRDFATNSIPLHDFISSYVVSTNHPYPDKDFWETVPQDDDDAVDIEIEL
jgi:hypothetical protein